MVSIVMVDWVKAYGHTWISPSCSKILAKVDRLLAMRSVWEDSKVRSEKMLNQLIFEVFVGGLCTSLCLSLSAYPLLPVAVYIFLTFNPAYSDVKFSNYCHLRIYRISILVFLIYLSIDVIMSLIIFWGSCSNFA